VCKKKKENFKIIILKTSVSSLEEGKQRSRRPCFSTASVSHGSPLIVSFFVVYIYIMD
jgi:hypothetical protein